MLKQKLLRIQEVLEYNYKDKLVALLLYGSYACEKNNDDSDIDIAVILKNYNNNDKLLLYKIMEDLSFNLNQKIDLVLFNETSTILKYQILKKNKLFCLKQNKKYYTEVMKAITEYADFKIDRKEVEENILKGRIYAG